MSSSDEDVSPCGAAWCALELREEKEGVVTNGPGASNGLLQVET